MTRARSLIVLVIVIFAIYAVLSSPEQSASVVRDAINQISAGLQAVGDFFNALISG